MSGHSKWANIQHRKGRQDKMRGKLFTRIGKEITIAARDGGNPEFNPRLRMCIEKAKTANMSKDVLERAIKKGTGELEGVEYIEMTYEGYGAAGVAFVVEIVTDNRNRSAASVRSNFARNDGNLGADGAVSWMFHRKGLLTVAKAEMDADDFMMQALDAGAEDVVEEDGNFIVYTDFADFMFVKTELESQGIKVINAETTMIPENTVEITDEDMAKKVIKLYDALEDNEDVQNIYANFEISDELMEKL